MLQLHNLAKGTMSNQKPQTLKGFRDFLPTEKRQRDFVAGKMRQVFELYGYDPLETPTLEYASLLLGKYGDEADKLVYTFADRGERQVGLRYDQTVPTARVLGQYQAQLPRYFRRYQIQNVFRADKPQQGRYREFTQCDCDIFGSTDAIADAEILAVYYRAFTNLGLKIEIQINDRQTLLAAVQPFTTEQVGVFSIIQTIDKLDKQSPAEVTDELIAKGLDRTAAEACLLSVKSAEMSPALAEIEKLALALGVDRGSLIFNPTLARGLDYYTGLIFEGRSPEYPSGSLGGGGRYDNLLGDLTGVSVPAVGFGIGFDRTVEVANQLGLIPTDGTGTQVLVTIFDDQTVEPALTVARQLRAAGIKTEVYPAPDKLSKQFKLADQKKIPFAIVIGEQEIAAGTLALKNLTTGEQQSLPIDQAITFLKQ